MGGFFVLGMEESFTKKNQETKGKHGSLVELNMCTL